MVSIYCTNYELCAQGLTTNELKDLLNAMNENKNIFTTQLSSYSKDLYALYTKSISSNQNVTQKVFHGLYPKSWEIEEFTKSVFGVNLPEYFRSSAADQYLLMSGVHANYIRNSITNSTKYTTNLLKAMNSSENLVESYKIFFYDILNVALQGTRTLCTITEYDDEYFGTYDQSDVYRIFNALLQLLIGINDNSRKLYTPYSFIFLKLWKIVENAINNKQQIIFEYNSQKIVINYNKDSSRFDVLMTFIEQIVQIMSKLDNIKDISNFAFALFTKYVNKQLEEIDINKFYDNLNQRLEKIKSDNITGNVTLKINEKDQMLEFVTTGNELSTDTIHKMLELAGLTEKASITYEGLPTFFIGTTFKDGKEDKTLYYSELPLTREGFVVSISQYMLYSKNVKIYSNIKGLNTINVNGTIYSIKDLANNKQYFDLIKSGNLIQVAEMLSSSTRNDILFNTVGISNNDISSKITFIPNNKLTLVPKLKKEGWIDISPINTTQICILKQGNRIMVLYDTTQLKEIEKPTLTQENTTNQNNTITQEQKGPNTVSNTNNLQQTPSVNYGLNQTSFVGINQNTINQNTNQIKISISSTENINSNITSLNTKTFSSIEEAEGVAKIFGILNFFNMKEIRCTTYINNLLKSIIALRHEFVFNPQNRNLLNPTVTISGKNISVYGNLDAVLSNLDMLRELTILTKNGEKKENTLFSTQFNRFMEYLFLTLKNSETTIMFYEKKIQISPENVIAMKSEIISHELLSKFGINIHKDEINKLLTINDPVLQYTYIKGNYLYMNVLDILDPKFTEYDIKLGEISEIFKNALANIVREALGVESINDKKISGIGLFGNNKESEVKSSIKICNPAFSTLEKRNEFIENLVNAIRTMLNNIFVRTTHATSQLKA